MTETTNRPSGPYIVKLALEGLPLDNFVEVEEPWRTWATRIVNERNGLTAVDLWENILASLPILKQRAVRAAVLSATADPEQWVDRLNEAFATSPYRRAAEKARRAFVEELHNQDSAFDIEKLLSPLTMIDSNDILTRTLTEPVWAVPGLIPTGLSMLAGRPKVGKSWLSMQFALAVATGGAALGQHVEVGRVLYLALEDSERRLQQRMKAQGWRTDAPGQVKFILADTFRDEIEYLNSGGGKRLIKHLEKEKYRLVIIDTFSRAFRGDQNDNEAMTAALDLLQTAANRLDVACIVVDHHTKPRGTDPNPIDDILGSSAKAAVPDTLIGLYKEQGKSGARLAVKSRVIEERLLQLSWDRELHCWQSEGDAEEFNLTEQRQAILDTLSVLKEASADQIADYLAINRGNTYKRLNAMADAGVLDRRAERGRVLYCLPATTSENTSTVE